MYQSGYCLFGGIDGGSNSNGGTLDGNLNFPPPYNSILLVQCLDIAKNSFPGVFVDVENDLGVPLVFYGKPNICEAQALLTKSHPCSKGNYGYQSRNCQKPNGFRVVGRLPVAGFD